MAPAVRPGVRLCFGDFVLDLGSSELQRNGVRLSIPEQPLRLLEVLLEKPGVVVSRDQLRERLWAADTFVDFEHGLNAAVKRLRDVLGDSADRPRFVETVPKRGYRFVGTVAGTPMPAAFQTRRRGRFWQAAALIGVLAAALAGVARWLGPTEPPPALGALAANETRITFASGLQNEPAWSPDGRMVAYASEVSGTRDIWVQPIAGGEPIQVTRSTAREFEPSWSSTGAIAYRVEGPEGGIYAVQGLGGPPQRLTSFGMQPKWSPDGRRLLFGEAEGSLGVRQRLFVVARDGRAPTHILQHETAGFDEVWSWGWHPDSERVSFAASRDAAGYHIFTVPASGGALVETVVPAAFRDEDFYLSGFAWAADGRSLILHGLRLDQTSSLWRLSVDPQSLQGQRLDRLKAGGSVIERPALETGGSRVVYGRPEESNRLWRIPLDEEGTRSAGRGVPLTDEGAWSDTSDLSPDGRSLVYTLRFAGSKRTELRLLDARTGESRTLASDGNDRLSVQWSRDGRRIAYMLSVPSKRTVLETAIAIRDLDSSEDRVITSPRTFDRAFHSFAPPSDFSPDGTAVLASSDYFSEHFSLALFPLAAAPAAEKGATIVVSDAAFNLWQGNYSPDGRWLAFAAQSLMHPGTTTIELVPASGGDARSWTHVTTAGVADKPRWSADGRRLYFLRSVTGSSTCGGFRLTLLTASPVRRRRSRTSRPRTTWCRPRSAGRSRSWHATSSSC